MPKQDRGENGVMRVISYRVTGIDGGYLSRDHHSYTGQQLILGGGLLEGSGIFYIIFLEGDDEFSLVFPKA